MKFWRRFEIRHWILFVVSYLYGQICSSVAEPRVGTDELTGINLYAGNAFAPFRSEVSHIQLHTSYFNFVKITTFPGSYHQYELPDHVIFQLWTLFLVKHNSIVQHSM